MRKINLKPYEVEINTNESILGRIISTPGVIGVIEKSEFWNPTEIQGMKRGLIKDKFQVKESIKGLLLNQRGISGTEFYSRLPLADKIDKCEKDFILLEDEEWKKVEEATSAHTVWGVNTAEFSRRIFEAEVVDPNKEKK